MKRLTLLTVLATTAAALAPIAFVAPADAQVPPRYGAYGDRDRDGIPNAYDRYDNRNSNRNGAWGDRDHDGIPNRYDNYDNRQSNRYGAWGDRDRDGIPNAYDRYDNRALRR